jgi:acyl-CoA synthetase (AMP-forming)/AMP-acid ligase II
MSLPHSPYEAFVQTTQRFPGHPFLQIPASARRAYASDADGRCEALTLSYREMLGAIETQRLAYAHAGYRAGHRVAMMLENRPDFFVHFFALNALGASIVPLNGDSRAQEIAYVAHHAEIVLAVGVDSTLERLRAALGDTVPVVDAASDTPPAAPSLSLLSSLSSSSPSSPSGASSPSSPSSASDAGPAFAPPNPSRPATLDDECAILYTSGTTGQPKGCILDNRYFLSIANLYLSEGGLCEMRTGVERLITPLPLFHMNALACSTMAMVLSGGCLIQLDRFHPRSWWQDVVASEATIMHYLGVMPAILLSMDEPAATQAAAQPATPPSTTASTHAPTQATSQTSLQVSSHASLQASSQATSQASSQAARSHRLRFGYGANVDPAHQHAFESRFGIPLIEAWAMTETGGAIVIAASREPRHVGTRCFGRPRESMAIRLVDPEGREVTDGTPGEMLVRHTGPKPREGFFRGYLKDPAATETAWAGGWFHTGDIVRRDENGSLHFVDRLKNIIRRAGENIAALEVEACLLQHEAVQQTAVIAAPDALRDEEVMACVVITPGHAADKAMAASLQQWCLDRLAYFKAPGYIAFIDALPTTSTNKVQKMRLAEFGANPLLAPLCFDLRAFKKRTA